MNLDFIITDIISVRKTDEKKYNGFVEYSPRLISNEIIYRPNGYSTVTFGTKTLETSPNSVHILPFSSVDKYRIDFKEPDYFIDIFFYTNKPVFTEPFVLNAIQSNRLNNLFNKAFSAFIKKDECYKFECISILYKIFAEINKKNYIPENKFLKIQPAIKYIETNFLNTNISCEFLAELCNISYSYLQRLFNEKYGLSPKKYIIQLKINYACDLLKTKQHSISEIAQMLGFEDLYFFSRQFKEYTGFSPKAYRNHLPK